MIKSELVQARKECNGVVFTGGEPTIHDSIIESLKTAKKLNFETIQVQTNGRMFAYPDFCKIG